jgi:hypothetical protein
MIQNTMILTKSHHTLNLSKIFNYFIHYIKNKSTRIGTKSNLRGLRRQPTAANRASSAAACGGGMREREIKERIERRRKKGHDAIHICHSHANLTLSRANLTLSHATCSGVTSDHAAQVSWAVSHVTTGGVT